MLVKPKCVWEVADFFNFRKFVYIFQLFVYNFSKNLPPLKHILALPTLGQIYTVTKLQPFEISTFQMKHPYVLLRLQSCLWQNSNLVHLGLSLQTDVCSDLRLSFNFAVNTHFHPKQVFKATKRLLTIYFVIILPPLRFYVKTTIDQFKRSKNVVFGNFRGCEFWFLVNLSNFQVSNLPKFKV